jgi:hypothetical protein
MVAIRTGTGAPKMVHCEVCSVSKSRHRTLAELQVEAQRRKRRGE